MGTPRVSVVTSVCNGGTLLRRSLESVLAQCGAAFELIAIDDGSTDGSSGVLAELARGDRRMRVLTQDNQGLTRALVRGCAEARGEIIARHDCDDLSHPDRLARQAALLDADPGLAFASCWSRALGPCGELLLEQRRPEDSAEATRALLEDDAGPPGHGSVAFRSAAYRRAGGYRVAFRYAQDRDLWLRLAEQGRLAYVPAFLYSYRVSEDSVSAARRDQQRALAELALRCRAARLRGAPEAPLLAEAARLSQAKAGPAAPGSSYFIGKCLLDRRDPRALDYLRRAARGSPLWWRPWAALAAAHVLFRVANPPTPAPGAGGS